MAAFMTVHAGSYGGLQEKSFSKRFKFLLFTLIILPLPPQNEIQQLSRFFRFSKLVCLFGLKTASTRDSSQTSRL